MDNHLKNTAPHTDGIYYIKVTGLTAADLKGDDPLSIEPSPLGKILNVNPSKKVALKLEEIPGLTDMSYCFARCKSLTQAPVIPSSVTNMNSCFNGCKSLSKAPEIPSSVTDMAVCFYGCTSLTQAPVIPNSVTSMDECFAGCTSLIQAPEIPSSVTDMRGCFNGCTSLTQAPVIPSSVTDMNSCFYNCKKITAVTLKCNYNAAEIYGEPAFKDAFEYCEKLTAGSIKVPAGQVAAYQAGAATMGAQADWFVAE